MIIPTSLPATQVSVVHNTLNDSRIAVSAQGVSMQHMVDTMVRIDTTNTPNLPTNIILTNIA